MSYSDREVDVLLNPAPVLAENDALARQNAALLERVTVLEKALENIDRCCGFGGNCHGMSADGVQAIQKFAREAVDA